MSLSRSSPCLGVFTDEPTNIARRLPRPRTPFVPAPLGRHFRQLVESDDVSLTSSGSLDGSPDDGFDFAGRGFDPPGDFGVF
jgi:hypothetical protein